jgi:hypothetical protein
LPVLLPSSSSPRAATVPLVENFSLRSQSCSGRGGWVTVSSRLPSSGRSDMSIATRCPPTHLQAPEERHVSTGRVHPILYATPPELGRRSMAIHSYRHDAPKGALPRAAVAATLPPLLRLCCGSDLNFAPYLPSCCGCCGSGRGIEGCSSQSPSFLSLMRAPHPTISD